jgi:hypothetical protein
MQSAAALALFASACSFHALAARTADAQSEVGSDAPTDAAPDIAIDAAPAFCPQSAHLRLCFSFDQASLPATLPDEGVATSSAQLTNVTRIASPLGGAAQLGNTSEIYFPMDTAVTGILASEIWFRMETDAPSNFARESMFDSNDIPPNISMFVYRNDPHHDLHCGIGSQSESWTTDAFTLAAWHHAECICANGNLSFYLDGVDLGDRPGNCATGGALDPAGITIGSNNNGGPSGVNDLLLGAIDGIRLWDETPVN